MKKELSPTQTTELIQLLKKRFEQNPNRHIGLTWQPIETLLQTNPNKLWSLHQMEETGGEPDVIDYDKKTNKYLFCDCALESPKGRRSLCYDKEALNSRKENKPAGSVLDMAAAMGVELLSEDVYRKLQQLGNFDAKTSSWITTPNEIRKLGGALFADFRYNTVFVYHNGASSYYVARGFRAFLWV